MPGASGRAAIASARVRSAIATSRAMAWAGGGSFLFGGAIGAVFIWAQGPSYGGHAIGYAVASVAVALGTILIIWGTRLPEWAYPPLVTTATLMISVLVAAASDAASAAALGCFYVSIASAAFFFTWLQAAVQISFAVVCCITVLAMRPDGFWWSGLVVASMVVAIGTIVGFMGRAVAEAELDPQTGLLNRRGFDGELQVAVSRGMVLRHRPALVLLDVNPVGASRGPVSRDIRDERLRRIAESWRARLGPMVILARFDVDRFAVIAPETTEQDAVALADSLCEAVPTGCTAGVTSGRRGEPISHLVGRAELALSRAGHIGHNRAVLESAHRPPLAVELGDAIAAGDIEVLYQPIVTLGDHESVVAVEALLRWQPKTRPAMTPAEVVGIAEQTNLITQLGRAVMRRACTDAQEVQTTIDRPFALSVNVSGLELVREDYAANVLDILASTGWPPAQLILEVTESVLDADTPTAIDVLRRLRRHGVRIAIDDFGSGYSSLSRLHLLPADFLKLDASFTSAITPDTDVAPPLLRAVAALATALRLPVLAEGVETTHQAAVFTNLEFAFAQGFLYGAAQPLPALVEMLSVDDSGQLSAW